MKYLFLLILIGCSSTSSIPNYVDEDNGMLVLEGSKKYYCVETKEDNNHMMCAPAFMVMDIYKEECNSFYPAPNGPEGKYVCWKK